MMVCRDGYGVNTLVVRMARVSSISQPQKHPQTKARLSSATFLLRNVYNVS